MVKSGSARARKYATKLDPLVIMLRAKHYKLLMSMKFQTVANQDEIFDLSFDGLSEQLSVLWGERGELKDVLRRAIYDYQVMTSRELELLHQKMLGLGYSEDDWVIIVAWLDLVSARMFNRVGMCVIPESRLTERFDWLEHKLMRFSITNTLDSFFSICLNLVSAPTILSSFSTYLNQTFAPTLARVFSWFSIPSIAPLLSSDFNWQAPMNVMPTLDSGFCWMPCLDKYLFLEIYFNWYDLIFPMPQMAIFFTWIAPMNEQPELASSFSWFVPMNEQPQLEASFLWVAPMNEQPELDASFLWTWKFERTPNLESSFGWFGKFTTGRKYPTEVGTNTDVWTNPSYLLGASDGVCGTKTSGALSWSLICYLKTYGFNIPAGATITKLTLGIKGCRHATYVQYAGVSLNYVGKVGYGGDLENTECSACSGSVERTTSFESPTPMPSVAELNSETFLTYVEFSGSSIYTFLKIARVDCVWIEVEYTI